MMFGVAGVRIAATHLIGRRGIHRARPATASFHVMRDALIAAFPAFAVINPQNPEARLSLKAQQGRVLLAA